MAIKIKSRAVYTTDRGDEFEVSQMASSHLLNAIRHHSDQLGAIVGRDALRAWQDELAQTIDLLAAELAQRTPGEDEPSRSDW